MNNFQKATRRRAHLRMALDGPPNSGKTFTALRFATAMGGKVGVIDSEHGRALQYVGIDMDGKPCEFDHLELMKFSPAEYVAAIGKAAQAGIDFLVIDGLSHAWAGVGGTLEQVSSAGKAFTEGWRDASPLHGRMIDAIIAYPGHVIFTMRSKMSYVLEKNDKGKEVPRKVGLAPVQRPGIEYEVDWVGELDTDHVLTMTKSPLGILDGAQLHKPGAAEFEPVKKWLAEGAAPIRPLTGLTMASDAQVKLILASVAELGKVQRVFHAEVKRRFNVEELHQLEQSQAEALLQGLRHELAQRASGSPATAGVAGVMNQAVPVGQPSPDSPATLQETLAASGTVTPEATSSPSANGFATIEQLQRLVELRTSLGSLSGLGDPAVNKAGYAAMWAQILGKRGVKTARELPRGQAQNLIDRLEATVAKLAEKVPSCAAPKEDGRPTPVAASAAESKI